MLDIRLKFFGRKVIKNNWEIDKSIAVNRIYIMHGGKGSYALGGRTFPLKKDYFYFFPLNAEAVFINNIQEPVELTYFDFTVYPSILSDQVLEICLAEHDLLSSAAKVCCFIVENENDEALCAANLNILFYLAQRIYPIQTVDDPRMNTVMRYIEKNYASQITVQALSALVYMETNYFIKTFKRYFKITPYQYLKDYRFLMAQRKIDKGEKISAVALACGFLSAPAFSAAYKKRFGVYPSEQSKI